MRTPHVVSYAAKVPPRFRWPALTGMELLQFAFEGVDVLVGEDSGRMSCTNSRNLHRRSSSTIALWRMALQALQDATDTRAYCNSTNPSSGRTFSISVISHALFDVAQRALWRVSPTNKFMRKEKNQALENPEIRIRLDQRRAIRLTAATRRNRWRKVAKAKRACKRKKHARHLSCRRSGGPLARQLAEFARPLCQAGLKLLWQSLFQWLR